MLVLVAAIILVVILLLARAAEDVGEILVEIYKIHRLLVVAERYSRFIFTFFILYTYYGFNILVIILFFPI